MGNAVQTRRNVPHFGCLHCSRRPFHFCSSSVPIPFRFCSKIVLLSFFLHFFHLPAPRSGPPAAPSRTDPAEKSAKKDGPPLPRDRAAKRTVCMRFPMMHFLYRCIPASLPLACSGQQSRAVPQIVTAYIGIFIQYIGNYRVTAGKVSISLRKIVGRHPAKVSARSHSAL